jgi:hypothetical protein
MFADDRSYFPYRAEIEVERAQEATAPGAVQAHYELAEAYLARLTPVEPVQAETT